MTPGPPDKVELTPSLVLVQRRDGFWLYDRDRPSFPVLMAKSASQAAIDALSYYHRRLGEVEKQLADLQAQIEHVRALVSPKPFED